MGVLDWGGDRRRGKGSFGGEFGASHCNQWGLFDALTSNYFDDLFSIGVAQRSEVDVFSRIALFV